MGRMALDEVVVKLRMASARAISAASIQQVLQFVILPSQGDQEKLMAGLDHGATHPKEVEDPVVAARNSRYGMVLFLVYLAIYGGFVGLNAFKPSVMDMTPVWGVNLAVLYGFALIVIAMVLALIYCWLCRERPQN